ncbi:MAG: hypothetical protein H6606_07910 [Flavobacteriales bacterium]|nr:hypothetical protein [Flavobacteriales bacterium]
MQLRSYLALLIGFLIITAGSCQTADNVVVGFYNVENLFDTEDEPGKIDEQFLPGSPWKWDESKYREKLHNLSTVIDSLYANRHAQILGLCEVENRRVLEDLIATPLLSDNSYGIVHYESDDARGIDNALLYDKRVFTVLESGIRQVDLEGMDDTTRPILWVIGRLKSGDTLICFVNHWPSRRSGKAESEPKRIRAAQTLRTLFTEFGDRYPGAAVIAMGDFNDEPDDISIRQELGAGPSEELGKGETGCTYINLMWEMDRQEKGTYRFRDTWNMLDQMIVNTSLMDGKGLDIVAGSTGIKDDPKLKQIDPKYMGYPLRTYGGQKYLGGYSDHFAVYTLLRTSK